MNIKMALVQALIAFVVIFIVAHFLMDRPADVASLYGAVAALTMGLMMGYLARDATEHVPGVTVKQAADAAAALLGGTPAPKLDGSIAVHTGFNYFWIDILVAPAKDGVTLRGSSNHIRAVKAKLTKL
jgi:hypothetical protein